jgi:hypothetical protein
LCISKACEVVDWCRVLCLQTFYSSKWYNIWDQWVLSNTLELHYIRTLSKNVKFICTLFRNRRVFLWCFTASKI